MELAAPKDNSQPKRLLPPAGEEAVRRSLTDGRGNCKARGTVVFVPGIIQPEPANRPRSIHPQSPNGDSSLLTEGAFGWLSPRKTANSKGFFPQRGRKLSGVA